MRKPFCVIKYDEPTNIWLINQYRVDARGEMILLSALPSARFMLCINTKPKDKEAKQHF